MSRFSDTNEHDDTELRTAFRFIFKLNETSKVFEVLRFDVRSTVEFSGSERVRRQTLNPTTSRVVTGQAGRMGVGQVDLGV